MIEAAAVSEGDVTAPLKMVCRVCRTVATIQVPSVTEDGDWTVPLVSENRVRHARCISCGQTRAHVILDACSDATVDELLAVTQDDDLRTDGGQTTRRRADDDPVDARAVTIEALREQVPPGESTIVIASHIARATELRSQTAGRILARLAGETEGVGEPIPTPADLEVERGWDGSSGVRWRVHREADR